MHIGGTLGHAKSFVTKGRFSKAEEILRKHLNEEHLTNSGNARIGKLVFDLSAFTDHLKKAIEYCRSEKAVQAGDEIQSCETFWKGAMNDVIELVKFVEQER